MDPSTSATAEKDDPITNDTQSQEKSALINGVTPLIVPSGTSNQEVLTNDPPHLDFEKQQNVPGPVPPDGGCRAYLVMIASFLVNGVIFGTINSGGILFDEFLRVLTEEKIPNAAAQASLTLSLAIGTTFFLSMVAGVLTDKLGIRVTTVLGGVTAITGMFLSSLCFTNPTLLTLSMGLMFGVGASLAYTPSLVILGHYFVKKIGFVNGFVTAGSSIGTILITWLLNYEVKTLGLKAAFQSLSVLMVSLVVAAIIFKPLLPSAPKRVATTGVERTCGSKCKGFLGQFINFEIWKNKRYVIWTLAIPCGLFGYFVPYVHLKTYAENVLGEKSSAEVIVQVIGGFSGIGRLAFGLIADRPGINRILLQQISFFCIGTLTMLLTLANNMYVFCAIAAGMGLFDGCFISLLGPIAFDIVGPQGASQAIGCLLAMCSIPLTLGPFIAGVMYDHLGSYTVPFLCAGVPPILGCFFLCFLRCIEAPVQDGASAAEAAEGKVKNNAEAEAFIPSGTTENTVNGDSLKVDVTRLVKLERESSV